VISGKQTGVAVLLASYRLPGCQPERRSAIVGKAPNWEKAQIIQGAGVDTRSAWQVDSHRYVFTFACKLRLKPGGPSVLLGHSQSVTAHLKVP
jgi:hypothetical protein